MDAHENDCKRMIAWPSAALMLDDPATRAGQLISRIDYVVVLDDDWPASSSHLGVCSTEALSTRRCALTSRGLRRMIAMLSMGGSQVEPAALGDVEADAANDDASQATPLRVIVAPEIGLMTGRELLVGPCVGCHGELFVQAASPTRFGVGTGEPAGVSDPLAGESRGSLPPVNR